ncbi:MAG: 30S ribosome-binding factor RbfA [Deltaproteobacteria bacterium]|nr:30S ribosome-binding factor RbfA [Deltaproteobacteria bacterium]
MRPRTSGGQRPTRVAELLRQCLAEIFLNRCANPRLQSLTITDVVMSPDLKQARISYLVRGGGDPGQLGEDLRRAQGFIKQEVARAHILRVMPEIIFVADQGLEQTQRLAQLLDQVRGDAEEG